MELIVVEDSLFYGATYLSVFNDVYRIKCVHPKRPFFSESLIKIIKAGANETFCEDSDLLPRSHCLEMVTVKKSIIIVL